MSLSVYHAAFSNFNTLYQFIHDGAVKLLHIQIFADQRGPLPDVRVILLVPSHFGFQRTELLCLFLPFLFGFSRQQRKCLG